MPGFEPTPDELKGMLAQTQRATERWQKWTDEGRLHVRLYRNELAAWNEIAPGGSITAGATVQPSTTVIRNVIGANVRTDIQKQTFKHPKFNCTPLVSEFYKMVNGQVVPVDTQLAAEAKKECLNYGFKRIKFRDKLRMVLEDAKLAGEGWVMCTSSGGFDLSESALWPENDGDGPADAKSRIKPRVQATSLAQKGMPDAAWISWEDVTFDPDALLDGQANWVQHKIKKPLSHMKSARDEEIDPATGEIRLVPRYKNLDKLEGAMQAVSEEEREKQYQPEDLLSNLPPEEYVWYYERHMRFPANSEAVRKQNGDKIPQTKDGWVKYICAFAELPGSNGDAVLLRWKPYDVDTRGFALKRVVFFRYNRQARGSSIIRDYREAVGMENYFMSMWATWIATNFPRLIADENKVKRDDVENAQKAGINAWVFVKGLMGGATLTDAVVTTPTTPIPQELPMMVQTFRSSHGEDSGRSANQRGQVAGVRTAEEVKTVAAAASEMMADEIEQIKEFVEDVAETWMDFFVAELPADGKFEVPNGTGGFLTFNRELLDVPSVFDLDYTSMMREDSELKKKQMTEFIAMLSKIPPQAIDQFDPFIRRLAIAFGPDFESAYTEFKKARETKDPAAPDLEHGMIREGQWVEPSNDEDFTKTIPEHLKHLETVLTDPAYIQWRKPQVAPVVPNVAGLNGRTFVPFEDLIRHIQISRKYGEKKGQLLPQAGGGGAGVPTPPGAQVSANDRGRGMMSGSAGQMAMPDLGEMEAGAMNVNTEGSGSMRGI